MDRKKVESSNLSEVGYDMESKILTIKFTNGRVYQYIGVPKWIYQDLIDLELPISKGRYFATAVKKNYQFKEIMMDNEPERRFCNDCWTEWNDTGSYECPFCGSSNTEILDDEDDEPEPIAA